MRYLIEKTAKDPISVKMLRVNGGDIMNTLNITPGPKIGAILDILLGFVLENPEKNDKTFLTAQVRKLGKLSEEKLAETAKKAEEKKEAVQEKSDTMTKRKYWVT